LCEALGFASINVECVEEATTGKQASKQANASANVLMMLKRGGREEGGRKNGTHPHPCQPEGVGAIAPTLLLSVIICSWRN
jgi:hypothetical protein